MSEKRWDNRKRILREVEYQRADGRYRYRYIDEDGKEKNVYSWRLDKNDPTPKGRKRDLSLREKEKQIPADLFDHIVTHGGKYTVLELVEKYNKIYRIPVPKVTQHVCRHTFCSNMAKFGMNHKTLQYIMGHSDSSVTLNVYTHVQFDDAQAELLRMAQA